MPKLNEAQRARLKAVSKSRNGEAVPGTEMPAAAGQPSGLNEAACWSWALAGGYVAVKDMASANSIYVDLLLFGADGEPTGLNKEQAGLLAEIFGDPAEIGELRANIPAAIAGEPAAQNVCRVALMRLAAKMNGLAVLDGAAGAEAEYTLRMRTDHWWAWQHWGIGIRDDDGDNVIQTVTGKPLRVGCTMMWDEGMTETVVAIDGLTEEHIAALRPVVGN